MGKLLKHLLAGCALLGLATAAQADRIIPNVPLTAGQMTISEQITQGTGDLAGFEIHKFFAAFTPTSIESTAGASRLQSVKATLSSPQNFKFNVGEFFLPNNGAANRDVDIYGEINPDDAALKAGTTLGDGLSTAVFVHDPDANLFSVQGLFVNGTNRPGTFNKSSSTNFPTTNFASVKTLRIEGFTQSPAGGVGGNPDGKTATAGQIGAGALFATAIVPTGTVLDIIGSAAADKGPVTEFATPEPGTLGFIGLAATTLLARRRRNA